MAVLTSFSLARTYKGSQCSKPGRHWSKGRSAKQLGVRKGCHTIGSWSNTAMLGICLHPPRKTGSGACIQALGRGTV